MTLKNCFTLVHDYVYGVPEDENGNKKYNMMTLGDGFKGLVDGTLGRAARWLKDSPKKLAAWTASLGTNIDDQVDVPVYSKTLTGDDFSTLYSSPKTISQKVSDGSYIDVYDNSASSYNTEMICGFGDVGFDGKHVAYDSLPIDQKATYETTLLFKKYSESIALDPENAELKAEFNTKLSAYKSACETNNVEWDTVLHNVSTELQYEVYAYNNEAENRLFGQDRSEHTRDVAVNAHNMLLEYAGSDFDDTIPAMLKYNEAYMSHIDAEGNYSFDNTVGVANLLNRAKNTFEDATQSVRNVFSGIDEGVKAAGSSIMQTADRLDSLGNNNREANSSEQSGPDF